MSHQPGDPNIDAATSAPSLEEQVSDFVSVRVRLARLQQQHEDARGVIRAFAARITDLERQKEGLLETVKELQKAVLQPCPACAERAR